MADHVSPHPPNEDKNAAAAASVAAQVHEFYSAHPDALFDETVIAAVLRCSVEKLQRDRSTGRGLVFVRYGRLIRYRKSDVLSAGQPLRCATCDSARGRKT